MRSYSNLNLIMSSSNIARIQEAHIFLGHYIFEQVENILFKKIKKLKVYLYHLKTTK